MHEHQAHPPSPQAAEALPTAGQKLRLLTYNMQVGIATHRYRHYITRGWQHLLPHGLRERNLERIAELIQTFDIVALQEADGGSLRSGFVNQVEYLAHRARFPYWYQQRNRNLGRLGQHGNGLLTRFPPEILEDHKLPGALPGRGAIVARFAGPVEPLLVVGVHLSLGARSQRLQLSYLLELMSNYRHVIVMGDMNSETERLLLESPLQHGNFHRPAAELATYPSWRPERAIDHILISRSITIDRTEVLDFPFSDHLPVAVELTLPSAVRLPVTATGLH
ncbi:MAG: endonuclease/exonuclease/phosphatase family protein [Pseudomonadales bacterium]|jgi:endonuclease/exonuclease/phosphatase family metal-dependent hydrolase|nr:endonuclease/exonuclease/phosphatase family protein [Pseudomonadales bacterium]HMW14923.1 endonuclease/exonuclease/phosphatase family protein [Pseudomonadales bacterium]HMW83285.1 endonuclease/exonuclease/phosphatase family protein [Pseudomonadales bacterium]HMY96601.1 endonuclease/exonuclease/phosphatase family protein [Pseudomonadales bacterium]HMZ70791.1 endonuclease/exonuclease/phosphatase family protein [Pseudomonadales bacterium]